MGIVVRILEAWLHALSWRGLLPHMRWQSRWECWLYWVCGWQCVRPSSSDQLVIHQLLIHQLCATTEKQLTRLHLRSPMRDQPFMLTITQVRCFISVLNIFRFWVSFFICLADRFHCRQIYDLFCFSFFSWLFLVLNNSHSYKNPRYALHFFRKGI